jgi:GDPmannose 4,6-dehydratase
MKKNKVAVITGINGQDGSYLAEFLLEKGYTVYGTLRRNSVPSSQSHRLDEHGITGNEHLILKYADLTDMGSLISLLKESMPDEIYNLGAQSHVRISFDKPSYTLDTIAKGTLNLLEAIRFTCPDARVYQAGSSEMFGNSIDEDGFQRITTPMIPVSPYGCAKLCAYGLARTYRDSYNMFICNGILFNHESPRRGANFVTNKIIKGAVEIFKGGTNTLYLGNLNASRDWGHAKDYVVAMWLMLQHRTPGDYICATGKSHTVKELVNYVFDKLNLHQATHIGIDPKYFRPNELNVLKGDSKKTQDVLGWGFRYTFETMIDEMVAEELKKYENEYELTT